MPRTKRPGQVLAQTRGSRARAADNNTHRINFENHMSTNTTPENLIGPDRVMDVRPIPCSVKHGLIIKTWLGLAVGEHFVLLNDHDPVPLYYQFAAQWPGAFTWEHLVKGPDEYRVKITKLRAVVDAGIGVAGSCGHH